MPRIAAEIPPEAARHVPGGKARPAKAPLPVPELQAHEGRIEAKSRNRPKK